MNQNSSATMFHNKHASASGGTISFVIGIVVLIIVIATVALPVIQEATANLTGTEGTILKVSGTLLAVLVIVYIANAM